MNNPTTKPMTRAKRSSIFHRIGKKMEKLEQNFTLPSSSSSLDYPSSSSDLPSNNHTISSEHNEDAINLSLTSDGYNQSKLPRSVDHNSHGMLISFNNN